MKNPSQMSSGGHHKESSQNIPQSPLNTYMADDRIAKIRLGELCISLFGYDKYREQAISGFDGACRKIPDKGVIVTMTSRRQTGPEPLYLS